MKFQNKKTGEIAEVEINDNSMLVSHEDGRIEQYYFDSLKDLEEWEDVPEEPKDYWTVDCGMTIKYTWNGGKYDRAAEAVGLKFDSEEECKQAIEKMKAWKRLKDKGFKFSGWKIDQKKHLGVITIKTEPYYSFEFDDLDLLFSGGEK